MFTINSEMEKINTEIKNCHNCSLSKTRLNTVPGEGCSQAEVLFIGEGPGKNEDLQGRPFVGAAGQLLDQLLKSINFKRSEIFIANIVKCRPPNNRDPFPEEIQACWSFLVKQITLIQPLLIVLLGRHSLVRFYPQGHISSDHGKAFRREISPFGQIIFFPCYHPAAALYNSSLKDVLFKDFQKIPKLLKIIKSKKMKKE